MINYLITDKNYTEVDIEKITEIEYPETDDELEDHLGRREPGLGASEEFSPDTLAALKKLMYDTDHPEEESEGFRSKREVEVTSVESCKERHKNCKILLSRVKKITKNVSNQVHQLHKMINRLGILNEELPSMKNFTVTDFNACLQCEKLEKETANFTFTQNTIQAVNKTNATDSYVEHLVNTANLTRDNISMVVNENLEELQKITESTNASSASSNSTNAPGEVIKPTNSTQEALEVKPVQTDPEQVYFRHSDLNPSSSGARMEAAEAVYSNPAPSTVPSTTTEVPDEDHQEIVTSVHSPDSKATYEPNPFLIPTAETSKTSQQMSFTPNVSWMPYPLCVYGPPNPPPQSVRQSSSGTVSFPVSSPSSVQSVTSPTSYAPYNVDFVQPVQPIPTFVQHAQPVQQGFQVLPMQFQPNSVPVQPQYGPTGPSVPYFPVNQAGHQPAATGQGRPIYCTYMPTPTFQFPVVPGVSEFQRTAQEPGAQTEEGDAWNKFEDRELKSRGSYAALSRLCC